MVYDSIMISVIDLFFVSLIAIGCLILATVSLVQNKKKGLNQVFALLSFSIGIWIVGAFLSDLPQLKHLSLFFNRFLLAAVLAVMAGIVYLAFSFPTQTKMPKWFHFLIITPSITIAILTIFTPLTIESIKFLDWGTDPVYGFVFDIFGIYSSLLLIIAIIKFYISYRKTKGLNKLQMKYLFFGLFWFMIVNIIVHLILREIMGTVKYYRFGNYSAVLFVGALAMAIFKHRLLDIRLVIARTIAYLVLILLLGFTYVFSFVWLGRYLFGISSDQSQVVFSAVLSLIIAFTFQPLLHLIERVTDRIFYQDNYDTQEFLNKMGKILTSTLSIDTLGDRILKVLIETFRIDMAGLCILDNKKVKKVICVNDRSNNACKENDYLEFLNHETIYIYDELPDKSKLKVLMRNNGFGCVLVLKSKKEFVGVIALGYKKNGMAYTSQDVDVLEVISKQLSIALENSLQYEEIKNFSEELKGKVKEATGELTVANDKLKELDLRKNEFINVAAHELRAPLTAVKGYLSMIVDGDAGKISKQVKEFVEGAVEGAEREIRLVNNMLNLSRIEEGRLTFKMGEVDLEKVAKSVFDEFKTAAEEKKLEFNLNVDKSIKDKVYVDQDRIHEVVANLVSNAIKYTDKGSVKMKLFNPEDKKNIIRFEVSDTGYGISKEERKKLFTKFFRSESSSGKILGTGLGLYIIKLLVEKFKGQIGSISEKDKGSVFWFELPLAK
jgi:signal transduction histidine kinase